MFSASPKSAAAIEIGTAEATEIRSSLEQRQGHRRLELAPVRHAGRR